MKDLRFTKAAHKQLRSLPEAARITVKIQRYAETGEGDVVSLRGSPGFRIRIGNYRAIFTETETKVLVHAVGHRRKIYD
ncbi:type II toxin-antitoxin system RelE family toxin [Nisaea sp.]|uniref:type II toxin-antitoxin system RelE family toxin n=1 Tax=Nisaea sp. TaxID=2024842 RepID=UPI003A5C592E